MTDAVYSPDTLDLLEAFLAEYRQSTQPDQVLFSYSSKYPELAEEFRLQAGFTLIDPSDEPTELPDISLLHEIGRGGMGVVFEGWQESLNRAVAVKLHRLTDARLERSRFLSECRTLARLHQSSIVPIYTSGRSGAWLYYVMPLLEGATLAELIRRANSRKGEHLPTLGELVTSTPGEIVALDASTCIHTGQDYIRSVVEAVLQVAEAIDYAHREGVWHLDLKPANLILDATGHCWIIDFGVALHHVDPEEKLTSERTTPGMTHFYAAPEQVAGSPDARSDVWGLGATLLELLTLRRPSLPFGGAGSETILPGRLNQDCPADLEAICLKCLTANLEERYQSAAELSADLRNWMSGHETTARAWSPVARAVHRIRRHRPWAVAVAAVVVGLVAVLILLWRKEQASSEQFRAESEAALAKEQLNREADSHTQARIWSLLEQVRQRSQLPAAGRRAEVRELLLAAARERKKLFLHEANPEMDVAFRSAFTSSLGLLDVVQAVSIDRADLPANAFLEWAATIHPDGKLIAVGTAKRPLVWHRGGEKPKADAEDAQKPRSRVEYGPQGRHLVEMLPIESGGGLRVWDHEAKVVQKELIPPTDGNVDILAIGFDEPEAHLFAAMANGRVQGWRTSDWTQLSDWHLAAPMQDLTAAAFMHGAEGVVFGNAVGGVRAFNSAGTAQQRYTIQLTKGVESLAWAPDGHSLGVGTADGILHVFDAEGIRAFRTNVSADGVAHIAFSPDSRWVTAHFRNLMSRVWDVRTGELAVIAPAPIWGFSRDGRTMAAGSGTQVIFGDILYPEVVRRLTEHRAAVDHLLWAQENARFVTLASDYEMRVWDAKRGSSMAKFDVPPSLGFWATQAAVALSPDGRRVAYASGGLEHSLAFIWDVESGKQLDKWELPGGFEKLAADGPNRFTLVREQTQVESRNVQTRVFSLEPGKPLGDGRLIRSGELTDRSRFIDHWLLPGGKYYAWAGPREPADRRRVEVYEVASGERVARVATPRASTGSVPNCLLAENMREMWILDDIDPPRVVDLRTQVSRNIPRSPHAVSPDGSWAAYQIRSPTHHLIPRIGLSLRVGESHWVEFATPDFQSPVGGSYLFSADSRYLALGSKDGSITLIYLALLRTQIDRFEKEMNELR